MSTACSPPLFPGSPDMKNVFSVSGINAYIRRMFAEDYLLRSVQIRGEVSNCKYHASGHIYFTLKDASGTLSCVMFAGRRRGLSFPMQNGDQVIAAGTVQVYERAGVYQLYADRIVRDGIGELAERFELLKKKLEEQGMFDPCYKQPLPQYIRTLGVVTAATGAAVRDIIQIAKRRDPFLQIILYPAIVQGDAAPDSIVRGIRTLDQKGVDVIIVGRGGGSLEDLWAFNEERVAQAVFECRTPVISAVGHETDTVITDFVADLRAPTPSAAAELAVFDLRIYFENVDALRRGLDHAMERTLALRQNELRRLGRELRHLSPDAVIRNQRLTVDRIWTQLDQLMVRRIGEARRRADRARDLDHGIDNAIGRARQRADLTAALESRMDKALGQSRHRMELLAGSLEYLSPLARLTGGYGFVTGPDGSPVRSVTDLQEGDPLSVRLRDGRLEAKTLAVRPDDPGSSFTGV